jgi:prevent-host-death family protein
MKVGTKDLKNRLSHYLRLVRSGEPVQVTDRGRVVAVIRAVAEPAGDDSHLLDAMADEGLVTRAGGRREDYEPVRPRRGRASAWVLEGRD